jgi:hypothetical protein
VVIDSNLNEITRYSVDIAFEEISAYACIDGNKFIIGTAIAPDQHTEPIKGYIYVVQLLENLRFKKLGEIETSGGIYKLAYSSTYNLIYGGIASSLYIYKLKQNFEIKMLKRYSEFIVINDILCYDDYIVVSDLCRSITLLKYNEERDKITECCRDNTPAWNNCIELLSDSLFYTSDISANISTFRREVHPKNDEDKYKLEKIAQFNLGERVTKFHRINKFIGTRDYYNIFLKEKQLDECYLDFTYFGTIDGCMGVIINLSKDVFEYLLAIQNKIVEMIYSTGGLDYCKWRSYKV